jgi:uncharacterized protein
MPQPVVWFEVVGKDAEKLKGFYGDLFGWEFTSPGMPGYWFTAPEGEDGLRGGVGAAPDGGPGHATFYVQTDDPQGTLDKAEQLGGKTVMPVTEMEGTTIALLQDPEGHTIGVVKPPAEG